MKVIIARFASIAIQTHYHQQIDEENQVLISKYDQEVEAAIEAIFRKLFQI